MNQRLVALGAMWLLLACQGPGPAPESESPEPTGSFFELSTDPVSIQAACSGQPGGGSFCGASCPCSDGQGDCDSDAECAPGLRCFRDVGAAFGWEPDVDVCMSLCPTVGNGSHDYCSADCPCDAEEGDCDSDAECAPGLVCFQDIGGAFGFDPEVDMCLPQCSAHGVGGFDHCSDTCRCGPGQGDCDSNAECADGLQCAKDAGAQYGFDPEVDVCVGTAATASLRIVAVDEIGAPITGATATLNDRVLTTDEAGLVLFDGLQQGRAIVQVRASGYTEATAVVELVSGAEMEAGVAMHALGQPQPFDAAQGAVLSDDTVHLVVPPSALVDASGNPVSGDVGVTIVSVRPGESLVQPGPAMLLRDGEEYALQGGAMTDITFWQDGERLQIAPDASVTIELLVPDAGERGLQPGDSTEILTYDAQAGAWVVDSIGTIQANEHGQLVAHAEIRHTSWFSDPLVGLFLCFVLDCTPCNPCSYRACSTGDFCWGGNQLYRHRDGASLSGCYPYAQNDWVPIPGAQTGQDCRNLVCLAGGRTQVPNNGDVPNDGNPCTIDGCNSGNPVFSDSPAGTGAADLPQTPNDCNSNVCNGRGSSMPSPDPSDLPPSDGNPCTDEACNGGSPEYRPVADGTLPAGLPQTAGDCRINVCDGNGGQRPSADENDLPPSDGNQCTEDVCDGIYPDYPPAAPGASCTDDGGFFCDGNRSCVECLLDDQCPELVCSAYGECLPATCADGVRNQGEGDVDCGGPCSPCDPGSTCTGFADCASLICAAGRCRAPRCDDEVANGRETDQDCGGAAAGSGCAGCPAGGRCFSVTDCSAGLLCLAGSCQ